MNRTLCILLIALVVGGCRARKPIVNNATARDTSSVEIRERIVERLDTIFVDVPREVVRQTVRRDTSRLENTTARSLAFILADGSLYHDLESKGTMPVQVKTIEVVRDSVIYAERVNRVTETKLVERELTKMQRIQMAGFWVLLALAVGWLLARILR